MPQQQVGGRGGRKPPKKNKDSEQKKQKKNGNGGGKCVGWIDTNIEDATKTSYKARLELAQRALDWYDRFIRLMDFEVISSLAKDAGPAKISWEISQGISNINMLKTRVTEYKKSAEEFVTNLKNNVNIFGTRGFLTIDPPHARMVYADELYAQLLGNKVGYSEKKYDVVKFFMDFNRDIRERIINALNLAYASENIKFTDVGSSAAPGQYRLGDYPVRLMYHISEDLFYVFYSIGGNTVPWLAYTIKIDVDGRVDRSHPESFLTSYDPKFSKFSSFNNHDDQFVEIPLTATLSTTSGGKLTRRKTTPALGSSSKAKTR
jgi:hypothetical protein